MSDIQLQPGIIPPGYKFHQVTIANGAAASEMVATDGKALIGVIMPTSWTAAALGFKTCISGNATDLLSVYDNAGNAETAVAAGSTHIVFPSADAILVPYLQITSVTVATATPVNQGGARTLILIFRSLFN